MLQFANTRALAKGLLDSTLGGGADLDEVRAAVLVREYGRLNVLLPGRHSKFVAEGVHA